MTIYEENGYSNRTEYLLSLAEDYGKDPVQVIKMAVVLGSSEDFDALVSLIHLYDDIENIDWFGGEEDDG